MSEKNAIRNVEIMAKVVAGRTYESVGAEYGISKSGIKDILVRLAEAGVFKPDQKRHWGIWRRVFGVSMFKRAPGGVDGSPGDHRYQRMLKNIQRAKLEKRAKNRAPSSAERDAEIVRLLNNGTAAKDVAYLCGLDVQRIYQIRKKHKLEVTHEPP